MDAFLVSRSAALCRGLLFVVAALAVTVTSLQSWAAGTEVPPVATGPETLAGFGGSANAYSYFVQTNSTWKGDITGIGTGLWRIEIDGIDMSGITGNSNGNRPIDFVLQNADTDGPNDNIGISATLGAGSDVLQAHAGVAPLFADITSTQILDKGDLTLGIFDLRYDIFKATMSDAWTVSPFYRLNVLGPEWTPFAGGAFQTLIGGQDFNSGRLDVAFEQGAGGMLIFRNFSVLPIPEPSTASLLLVGIMVIVALRISRRSPKFS